MISLLSNTFRKVTDLLLFRTDDRIRQNGPPDEATESRGNRLLLPVRVHAGSSFPSDQNLQPPELRGPHLASDWLLARREHLEHTGLHVRWGHEPEVSC